MKAKDLLKRKVKLVLTKMDPQKVNDAILSIYKGILHGVHYYLQYMFDAF